MKNIFFLLVASLATLTSSAQLQWNLGASSGALVSYRRFSADNIITDYRDESEKPDLGFTASIESGILVKEHWIFKVGIGWLSAGYINDMDGLRFGDEMDVTGPPAPGASVKEVKFTYIYQSLIVPLKAGYRFSLVPSKHYLFALAGVNNHFLMNVKQRQDVTRSNGDESSSEKKRSLDDYNRYLLSGNLELGYELRLKKISVTASVNGLYFFTPINKSNPSTASVNSFKEYMYAGGINLGVVYWFTH